MEFVQSSPHYTNRPAVMSSVSITNSVIFERLLGASCWEASFDKLHRALLVPMVVVPPSLLRISSHVMAYPYDDRSHFSIDVEPNYKERAADRWESVKMRVLRARSVIALAPGRVEIVNGTVRSGDFASVELARSFAAIPDEDIKFTMFGNGDSMDRVFADSNGEKHRSREDTASSLLRKWVDGQVLNNILSDRTFTEHAISGVFHAGKRQLQPLMLRGVSAVLGIPGIAHNHWGCYDGFMFWIGAHLTRNDIDNPYGAIGQWLGGSRDWVQSRGSGAGADAIVDSIQRSRIRSYHDWAQVPRY